MPASRAGEQEDHDQQRGLGNAASFGGDLGIADRGQRAAEPAAPDVDRHPGADRRDGEAEIVEAPLGIERRRKLRPGHADAAAGHALPGERDLRDDGGKAERRDREIEGAQPQRRQSDDQPENGTDAASGQKRQIRVPGGPHVAGRKHGGDVGAERQDRDPADGKLAGEARPSD